MVDQVYTSYSTHNTDTIINKEVKFSNFTVSKIAETLPYIIKGGIIIAAVGIAIGCTFASIFSIGFTMEISKAFRR